MLRILWIMLLGMGLTFAQTAAFPGAIATTADLLVAKDRSASTLTSGINASTLTVPVVAGAQFVAYGIVTIDTEQMQICSIASNVLTICNGKRGFGGTTAATHSSGAAVRGNIAAWHHNALSAELRAVQTALGANLANIRTLSPDGTQTYITTRSLTFIDGLNRLKVGYGAVTNNVVEAQVLADSVAGNLLLSSRTNYASGIFFYTNAATAAVERMRIGSDGTVVIGGVVQATGVTLATTAAPTCAAGIRGRFNYVAGGVGVKDIIQVCGKAANDTYAWVAIY